jgi:hypothetical protein
MFGDRPQPPVLVRVRVPGRDAPDFVELDARWEPSGARDARTLFTADGLCILPWRRGQRAVELVLRASGGIASLRIEDHENEDAYAHDVELEEELAAE